MATSTNPFLIIGACLSTSLGDRLANELVEGKQINANYLANALHEEGIYCRITQGKQPMHQVIDTSLGEWRIDKKGKITSVPWTLRDIPYLLEPVELPQPSFIPPSLQDPC